MTETGVSVYALVCDMVQCVRACVCVCVVCVVYVSCAQGKGRPLHSIVNQELDCETIVVLLRGGRRRKVNNGNLPRKKRVKRRRKRVSVYERVCYTERVCVMLCTETRATPPPR